MYFSKLVVNVHYLLELVCEATAELNAVTVKETRFADNFYL